MDNNCHDYLSRDFEFCQECGDQFISDRFFPKNRAVVCSGCTRSMFYEPWDHSFYVYRALRPDEDVETDDLLRSRDPNAN